MSQSQEIERLRALVQTFVYAVAPFLDAHEHLLNSGEHMTHEQRARMVWDMQIAVSLAAMEGIGADSDDGAGCPVVTSDGQVVKQ